MARFDTSGLDDMIREMTRMNLQSGELADAMCMAAAEEVRKGWRRSAEEHGHRDTGEMIESIGYARKPKDIGGIKSIDIYPQGKDSKGVRNAEKAFVLHYGTSKIEGSHWVDDADDYPGAEVEAALTQIWNDYVQTGTIPRNTGAAGGSKASGSGIHKKTNKRKGK